MKFFKDLKNEFKWFFDIIKKLKLDTKVKNGSKNTWNWIKEEFKK